MADVDDKEKAEKLAAAKKRYEQLKKQKGKKGGASKKKEESKASEENEADTQVEAGEASTATTKEESSTKPEQTAAEVEKADDALATNEQPTDSQDAGPTSPTRTPSLSLQSRMRSESFRQTSISQRSTPLSPSLKSPGAEGDQVQDIYRKQLARIEELEKENGSLRKDKEDAQARLVTFEDELEELRAGRGELGELRSGMEELEKLKVENASLQRQLTHLQSASAKPRQPSTSSPSSADDLSAELASKSTTIESLELELSNLQSQLSKQSTLSSTQSTQITALQASLSRAEAAAKTAEDNLAALKKNLDRATERNVKEVTSLSSAETRMKQLETSLSDAQKTADDKAKRIEALEQKISALTNLHKESDARSQARLKDAEKWEKEAKDLKSRVTTLSNENARLQSALDRARRKEGATPAGEDGDDGVDELAEEETSTLRARIRDLEAENFDLKRGVWREKRAAMQPGMEDADAAAFFGKGGRRKSSGAGGFDEVDLGGGTSPRRPGASPYTTQRLGSTFQDVIQSGISAFTGQDRHGHAHAHGRGRGHSHSHSQHGNHQHGEEDELLDDEDLEFDEDAFRAAQEEEGRKRIERVREVKKNLVNWKGWRVDLVEAGGGSGFGPVFDV